MSRSISSIATSELSNLNFVDLDEQEMITLAGGTGGGSVVNAPVGPVNAPVYAPVNAPVNAPVGPVNVGPVDVA